MGAESSAEEAENGEISGGGHTRESNPGCARVCVACSCAAPLSSTSPSAAYVEQAAGGAVTAAVPLAEAAVPLVVVNREGGCAPAEPLAVMKAA